MRADNLKIEIAMAKAGLSKMSLSEKSGISRITISRLKSRNQETRPQTIGSIAKALGVKVEDLLIDE